MSEPVHPFRVRRIAWEAKDVFSFELEPLEGRGLKPFAAGAHVDLELPNGLMRSYSLSDAGRSDRYRITVARDINSAGGSSFLAEKVRAGDTLKVGDPRNNFPLREDAVRSVFIAGGIGVTPFVPMAMRLNELGRPWRLHYCVRTRDRAALLEELQTLAAAGQGEVIMNFDEEPGGTMLDLRGVISGLGAGEHVYCCGPIGMLDAFRASCDALGIESERVHFEYFKSNVESATEGGFKVVLARSGITLPVKSGETILQAVLAAGVDVPSSCEEGVCGSCETRVLAGEPDHRDLILSDQEKKAGRTMMICCSGSKSASLTLDL